MQTFQFLKDQFLSLQIPVNEHYLNRYIKFILSCEYKETGERHHILPKAKSLFPQFQSFVKYPWNLCKLGYREHYLVHWMLKKALPSNKSMKITFNLMSRSGKSSKKFEMARIAWVKVLLTDHPMKKGHTRESKNKISMSQQNRTWTPVWDEDMKEKARIRNKGTSNPYYGKKHTQEWKDALSYRQTGEKNHQYGKKASEEVKAKLRQSHSKTPRKTCEHCGVDNIHPGVYARLHGSRCKKKL